MTTYADFMDDFATCRTIIDANTVYQRLYREHVGDNQAPITPACDAIQEAWRRTMERMSIESRIEAKPHDPSRARPHDVRNWCKVEGIPIRPRGKISVVIENSYREAHDMPLLEIVKPVREPRPPKQPKPAKIKVDTTGIDPKAVRAWAREQGIEVGGRGRLQPELLLKYKEEVAA